MDERRASHRREETMSNLDASPFGVMRDKLRVQEIPLRIAVARFLLAEIIAANTIGDRDRWTRYLVKLLDDIAEDHA